MAGIFAIAVSLGVAVSLTPFDADYVYVQSNITRANPNIVVAPTDITLATEEIHKTKLTVALTVQ